jgi:hypothetical protein
MYAFCQDMPGATLEQQEILQRHLPPEALDGCIVHVVGPYDGGVRMVDVWVDEESYRRFQREVLWPALDRAMSQMPIDSAAPQPFVVHEVTGSALGAAVSA